MLTQYREPLTRDDAPTRPQGLDGETHAQSPTDIARLAARSTPASSRASDGYAFPHRPLRGGRTATVIHLRAASARTALNWAGCTHARLVVPETLAPLPLSLKAANARWKLERWVAIRKTRSA